MPCTHTLRQSFANVVLLACAAAALSGSVRPLIANERAVVQTDAGQPPGGVPAETRATLDAMFATGHHPWLTWPAFPRLRPILQEMYEAEGDGLFWFDGGRPIGALKDAVDALANAGAHGLNPADYDAAALAERAARYASGHASDAELAQFDVAVSICTARLLTTLREGRVDPRIVGIRYDVGSRRLDVKRALLQARGEGLAAAIRAAAPDFPVYRRLVTALARYRDLARAGEPAVVPALGPTQKSLRPGGTWVGLPALAARLQVLGDLAPGTAASTTYDRALVEAVKHFQDRHALEPDGTLGATTITALNVPLAARVRQIELALERERWLPDTRSTPLVFVNVPLFRLWAYDPARPDDPFRMNVVVGKSLGHETPIFNEEMEYVVFSPFWNLPPSIVRSEVVPKARKDPGYLARQNMQIVSSGAADAPSLPADAAHLDAVLKGKLVIRQKPGPRNSLGPAKFIFPNADNVYMHGTPAQALFSRARRDFSHGCIRLADPAAFAAWVLRDQKEWTGERIREAMQAGTPRQVNLKQRLSVLIFYDTAYVDSANVVHFADDYYGHDARLEKALKAGYPYERAN